MKDSRRKIRPVNTVPEETVVVVGRECVVEESGGRVYLRQKGLPGEMRSSLLDHCIHGKNNTDN